MSPPHTQDPQEMMLCVPSLPTFFCLGVPDLRLPSKELMNCQINFPDIHEQEKWCYEMLTIFFPGQPKARSIHSLLPHSGKKKAAGAASLKHLVFQDLSSSLVICIHWIPLAKAKKHDPFRSHLIQIKQNPNHSHTWIRKNSSNSVTKLFNIYPIVSGFLCGKGQKRAMVTAPDLSIFTLIFFPPVCFSLF